MKTILIIRPDHIGDFIIFTAVLKYYKLHFSDYKIDILCNKCNKDLVIKCPYIEKTFYIEDHYFRKYNYFNKILMWLKFHNLKYDIIIYPVFSRCPKHEWLLKIIKGKDKIVFQGDSSNDPAWERINNNLNYTMIVPCSNGQMPEIERNLEFLRGLGFSRKVDKLHTEIWLSEQDYNEAKLIMEKYKISQNEYVVCCPGAYNSIKHWSVKNWKVLLSRLWGINRNKIVLIGSKKESILLRSLIKNMKKVEIINLCGEVNLRVLAIIIQKAKFVVGVDSGPIHIAAGMNTPNICIVGGGHFNRFYPYGDLNLNRVICNKLDCYDCNWNCLYLKPKCIDSITVDDVVQAIKKTVTI
ncbi:MAG: glycosyltransferase family 9 protein [Nanoarchaeota archaeon]|nr:glycosyltransferase family 9 protein [Nanoarchaeota archaeon]